MVSTGAVTGWLIDKSALWKLTRSPDFVTWHERIGSARVWVSLPTRLEVAVSARNSDHWHVLSSDLLAPLLTAYVTPKAESVAVEIMAALVTAGRHRTVSIPDVMIASIAAVERLTVLHDDQDFDRIRELYGSPDTQRLVT